MKTLLVVIIILLLIAAIAFYVLGHFQIAFGIGFLLIILFTSGSAFYYMENREYLRKKADDLKERERNGWRKK